MSLLSVLHTPLFYPVQPGAPDINEFAALLESQTISIDRDFLQSRMMLWVFKEHAAEIQLAIQNWILFGGVPSNQGQFTEYSDPLMGRLYSMIFRAENYIHLGVLPFTAIPTLGEDGWQGFQFTYTELAVVKVPQYP